MLFQATRANEKIKTAEAIHRHQSVTRGDDEVSGCVHALMAHGAYIRTFKSTCFIHVPKYLCMAHLPGPSKIHSRIFR